MGFRNRIVRLSQLTADSIVGAVIATASSGARWVLGQGNGPYTPNELYGYSGGREEIDPANLRVQYVQIGTQVAGLDSASLILQAPGMAGGTGRGQVEVNANAGPGGGGTGNVVITGDRVQLSGASGGQPHVFFGDYDQCFPSGVVALAGTNPPAGTPKLELQGSAVVTTNASGNVFLPFNGSFPNGVVSLLATSGDGNAWTGNVTPYGYGLNGANVMCRNPTVSGTVRINYHAIGW